MKLTCPECGSTEVTVTAEQALMVNTDEHYCYSVKTHDDIAKAECLACRWEGQRRDLVSKPRKKPTNTSCGCTYRKTRR